LALFRLEIETLTFVFFFTLTSQKDSWLLAKNRKNLFHYLDFKGHFRVENFSLEKVGAKFIKGRIWIRFEKSDPGPVKHHPDLHSCSKI
jgi:hypothetical protein